MLGTLSVPVTIPKENNFKNKGKILFWFMASGHSWTCCFGAEPPDRAVVEAAHLPVARKQDERNRKGAGPKYASKLSPF